MSRTALFGSLVLAAIACGGSEPARDAESAEPAASRPVEPALRAGRDLGALDMCQVVPTDLVVETLGGSVASAGVQRAIEGYSGCEYGIRPRGGATYESVSIWAQPPGSFPDAEENLALDRRVGHKVDLERLTGLGDEAFVINDHTEEQSSAYVLIRGDLSLQVTAETRDRAVKLAEVTLSRLPVR